MSDRHFYRFLHSLLNKLKILLEQIYAHKFTRKQFIAISYRRVSSLLTNNVGAQVDDLYREVYFARNILLKYIFNNRGRSKEGSLLRGFRCIHLKNRRIQY